jgi:hypothetical protein
MQGLSELMLPRDWRYDSLQAAYTTAKTVAARHAVSTAAFGIVLAMLRT